MMKFLSMNPATLGVSMATDVATVGWDTNLSDHEVQRLLKGDILLNAKPCANRGGGVTARMCLPLERDQVWAQLTNYPRWVEYFPDLIRSEMLSTVAESTSTGRRLYQVARKSFLMFSAQVEIYLRVFESIRDTTGYQIRFCLEQVEKGSFRDFSADLKLQNCGSGTLLTYSVQATPALPMPATLIQEAIRLDLPTNMQQMRQVLCDRPGQ